ASTGSNIVIVAKVYGRSHELALAQEHSLPSNSVSRASHRYAWGRVAHAPQGACGRALATKSLARQTRAKNGKKAMAADRAQNLQDTFLNHVRKSKVPLTIFLVNGVKLQGVVTW